MPVLEAITPQGLVLTHYRTPVINYRLENLRQYSLEMDIAKARRLLEIEFCRNYSWVLDMNMVTRTGFYHKANGQQKHISAVDYGKLLFGSPKDWPNNEYPRLLNKKLHVRIQCNLLQGSAEIYINNKFYERIYFHGDKPDFFISVMAPATTDVVFGSFKINNNKGQGLFIGNYKFINLWKILSQLAIGIGAAFLLIFSFFEKKALGLLYIFIAIVCTETFLRFTEADNPALNIHKRGVKWDFEKTTNLFGQFNDPEKITIVKHNKKPETFYTKRPKDSVLIICLGSSPVAGFGLADASIPDILEDMINRNVERKKHRVINAGLYGTDMNSAQQNIYFTDVLVKFNPEAIVLYSLWGIPDREDEMLYIRAKKVLAEHTEWIKDQRLLFMALEFKRPIKQIVYIYNFLCESYIFMGIENIRKKIFKKLPFSVMKKSINGSSEFSFDRTLRVCEERGIKIFLIPQFNFIDYLSDDMTHTEMRKICEKSKNAYYVDVQDAFFNYSNLLLAYDIYHATEKGNRIIAEEIYRALIKEKVIPEEINNINSLQE